MEKYRLKHQVEATSIDTEEGKELLKKFVLLFDLDPGSFYVVKNWITSDISGMFDANGNSILALINSISFNKLFELDNGNQSKLSPVDGTIREPST